MTQTLKLKLLNLAVFQVGWTVCILGGDRYALVFTAAALLLHHFVVMRDRREWWLIVAVSTVGIGWDSLMIAIGVLTPTAEGMLYIPLWLACLWILFSTTLAHCMAWLARRLPLAFALAVVFGPLSYWIGSRLADVSLATPLVYSLLVIAVGWGLLMPGAMTLTRRLQS